jgi:hypothetical protein
MTAQAWGRVYRRVALPATVVLLCLLTAAWVLLRWHWLEISAVGCLVVVTGQVLFNDIARDKPAAACTPAWLMRASSWARLNAGMISYPVGAISTYLVWTWAGWSWLPAVAAITGVALLLEMAALMVARRSNPYRSGQHLTRMLLSSLISLWLDFTILIYLPGEGATALHGSVLVMAVAVGVDVRAVYRNRNWWPWRH